MVTRRAVLSTIAAVAGTNAAAHALPGSGLTRDAIEYFDGALSPDEKRTLVALIDYEEAARRRIPSKALAYISGGAGDELTLRWNREAYDKIVLRPRVLADLSHLDTRVTLFDSQLPHPILLAPAACHQLVHREGELATARGANAAKALMSLSSFTNTPVEDVMKQRTGPTWFQLYDEPDREFTREQVQRAEAAGCKALAITVDTPVTGARNRQERSGFTFEGLPLPHLRQSKKGRADSDVLSDLLKFNLTWKDISWLRSITKMRVLIKGVLDEEDAAIAARENLDGVIVSNHGARNLDTAPATINALPRVVAAIRDQGSKMPIIVDGGIRRGTDVLKALALGANAVQIGRPYLYGLSVDGAAGVTNVVDILRREFEMAMALTGRDTIASIDAKVLRS
jgi:4-hydroxymandelate oxidase